MRRKGPHHRLLQHLVIVGIVIILIGVVAALEPLHRYADAVIVWGEGIIAVQPYLGMAVFVALAMLSAMVAFFSSALFVPLAIYTWGNAITMLLLWTGWLLGGIASFCIGRFLGRRVATAIIGEEKISGWQDQLARRNRFLEVLLFQAVVPSEIPGYVLGILRYRFLLYLLALAITELPYVFGVVYLGENFLQGQSPVILAIGLLIVVVAAVLLNLRGRLKLPGQSS